MIEWIAAQPWCDGNVGMVGISGFGAEQLAVAKKQPPHLKAIFPFDSRGAYGEFGGFRDEYPGGVIHLFRYLVGHFSAMHQHKGPPGALPPEQEKLWLDPNLPSKDLIHELAPVTGGQLTWYRVSDRVNKVTENDAGLIEAV